MSFEPSSTKSSPGLTRDIFEVYALYKKGTADVIRWLSSSLGPGVERCYLFSINELQWFADQIILRGIDVPDNILAIFRRTVRARKRLASFYERGPRVDDEATESHAYFNRVFESVFEDLCRFRLSRNNRHVHGPNKDQKQVPYSAAGQNPFARLLVSETQDTNGTHETPTRGAPKSADAAKGAFGDGTNRSAQNPPDAGFRRTGSAIKDDLLDELTYLSTYYLQLRGVLSLVKEAYAEAARGSMPLVVAVATTEAAYDAGKILGASLHKYGIRNPTYLLKRYEELQQSLRLLMTPPLPSTNSSFCEVTGPPLAWECLCRFRDRVVTLGCSASCLECGKNEGGSVAETLSGLRALQHDGRKLDDGDYRESFDTLLGGIYEAIRRPNAIWFSPRLVRDFRAFLHPAAPSNEDQDTGLGLAFGLHLLLESCLVPAQRNCRIQALQFSADMRLSIKRTMDAPNAPCACLSIGGQGVASLLASYHCHLSSFLSSRHFDFFHQNPWVSGGHIARHLAQGSDYAAKAWHYGYYVGTVLHIYNGLVQAGILACTRLPVLEALCTLFQDAVFLGKRNTHNVVSCWRRWSGGKIKQVRNHDGDDRLLTPVTTKGVSCKGQWHFCSVPDASQGGNHRNRSFTPINVSLFSTLADAESILDERILAWVHLPREKRKRYQAQDIRCAKKALMEDGPITNYVARIQSVLLDEFVPGRSAHLPVARMNYFSFYRACMQVMRQISMATHEKDPGYICICTAELCLRECDAILKQRLVGSRKTYTQEKVRTRNCDICLEQLLAVYGNINVEDILWEI